MILYYTLIIIYLILFVALSVKRMEWAVCLVVFALPSYLIRFKVGWLPMTLLEAMILILFLVWWIKTIKYRDIKTLKQAALNYKPLFILCGLFLMLATVAIWMGPDLRAAAGIWKAYFIEPILFLLVLISTFNKRNLDKIFYVLSWALILVSVIAVYQKITGNLINNPFWAVESTRRVTGVFEYPNALALYLAPIWVLLTGWLIIRIRKLSLIKVEVDRQELSIKNVGFYLFALTVIFLGLWAVYFTKSKGALLGMLAGVFFYTFFYKGIRKYFIGILLMFVLLGGYFIQVGEINLRGAATVEGGDSVTTRLEMWRESWQMLNASPWWGAGLAGYQAAVQPFHQKDYIEIYLYPHNIFLNFWSELGLLGLLSFLLIIVWFYKVGFKNRESGYSIILMAGMTTLLVHGLVDVPYFKNDLSVLFWLLVGMLLVELIEKNREKTANRV